MRDPTANDDRCLQGGSVELLATDGFVLLHALCGGALVELVINVSQERARALGEDAEPFLAEWFTPSLAAPHNTGTQILLMKPRNTAHHTLLMC